MNGGLPGPNTTDTVTGGKTLELSKYDKIRRPHKTISDETKIKVTVRTLSTELCCPICLDLLTCTMTTKECLHRFCSECITTALMRGNKECPTCRKKIVSKRSLRPDPNFDFLISKIWPDRKLYDAELNASMQFFQEQSNVAALQKSIEEGIKAQAAYRKQRVQGSYDYEKRKRRPPKIAMDQNSNVAITLPTSSSTEIGGGDGPSSPAGTGRASDELVEQVVVTLTPVEAMEIDAPSSAAAHIQQMPAANTEFLSSEETDASSDLSSEDSSDLLSSDSTLSPDLSSDELSNVSTVRSVMDEPQQPSNDLVRSRCVSSEEGADLLIIDSMADEMCRRGDEIEVELAPSKSLLSSGSVPAQMHCSHFVRAPSEITMEHIGEFLLQRSRQISDNPTKTGSGRAAGNQQQQSQPQQPLKLAPKNFHILDRQYQLRKLCPGDTLCMAFLLSIHWDRHLTIFFELNGEEQRGALMAEIVGEELAKIVEEQRKADREEEERESHRKEEEKKSGAEKRESERSSGEMSGVKMEIQ